MRAAWLEKWWLAPALVYRVDYVIPAVSHLKPFFCATLISGPGEVQTAAFLLSRSVDLARRLPDRWAGDASVYVQRSGTPRSAGVLLSSAADLHLVVWPRSKTQSFLARCALRIGQKLPNVVTVHGPWDHLEYVELFIDSKLNLFWGFSNGSS